MNNVVTRRLRLALATLALGASLTVGGSLPLKADAAARRLACNPPTAYVPVVDTANRRSQGAGQMSCGGWETVSWTVRLYNNSGGILAEYADNNPYATYVSTPITGCAGAIVKSWLYQNEFGIGKSDTSGTNSACAY